MANYDPRTLSPNTVAAIKLLVPDITQAIAAGNHNEARVLASALQMLTQTYIHDYDDAKAIPATLDTTVVTESLDALYALTEATIAYPTLSHYLKNVATDAQAALYRAFSNCSLTAYHARETAERAKRATPTPTPEEATARVDAILGSNWSNPT